MTLSKKKPLWSAVLSVLVLGSVAIANNVTLPNLFQPNTPARAAEVNANFAAVKSAVDDSQTQITALVARSGVRLFRKAPLITFPVSAGTAAQVNQVDVFLGTVTSAGIFEVRFDVYDVNASWNGSPEWFLKMGPVLNGAVGFMSPAAIEYFGGPIKPPLTGSTSFAVSAGQSVSVRVQLETSSPCIAARGFAPNCIIALTVDARFSPGVTLE